MITSKTLLKEERKKFTALLFVENCHKIQILYACHSRILLLSMQKTLLCSGTQKNVKFHYVEGDHKRETLFLWNCSLKLEDLRRPL